MENICTAASTRSRARARARARAHARTYTSAYPYIDLYTYIAHTDICTYPTYIHTCVYECIYIFGYFAHAYTHTYVNTCFHTYVHTYVHIYTYAYILACMLTSVHTCKSYVWLPKVSKFIFIQIVLCLFSLKGRDLCTVTKRRSGYALVQLVEALRYKPEGRGFVSRCGHLNLSLA